MFKFLFISVSILSSSAQAMELTWDNHESGTGLHVIAKGKDKAGNEWIGHETLEQDIPFYQDLFGNQEVVKLMGDGTTVPQEEISTRVNKWVERFAQGRPYGGITIAQQDKSIGYIQLGMLPKRPGVGYLARAFLPDAQGKGLGTSALKFLVEEWAPTIHNIGIGKESNAPEAAVEKFKCFDGKELQMIYTTARPSNPASWQCYKHFDFHPSPATNTTLQISCVGWEESQHGPLEEHIIHKHFAPTSLEPLEKDALYSMLDENTKPRTLSFLSEYKSLRYHFEHEVK